MKATTAAIAVGALMGSAFAKPMNMDVNKDTDMNMDDVMSRVKEEVKEHGRNFLNFLGMEEDKEKRQVEGTPTALPSDFPTSVEDFIPDEFAEIFETAVPEAFKRQEDVTGQLEGALGGITGIQDQLSKYLFVRLFKVETLMREQNSRSH